MKIVFTTHAQYRLMERKISLVDVRTILLGVDGSVSNEESFRVRKKISGKILEVEYKMSKNGIVVITAYYI